MKKILLILVLSISAFVQAQQEVKASLSNALVLKTVEVSYEYYTTERSSIGISTLINFEKKSADFRYNEDWMIAPYFRHYFTDNSNWNYFGEVFMGINGGENDKHQTYTDGALGLAFGTKYVSSGGFLIDVYAGLGRNMFTAKSPSIVPRVGVSLGYRF